MEYWASEKKLRVSGAQNMIMKWGKVTLGREAETMSDRASETMTKSLD